MPSIQSCMRKSSEKWTLSIFPPQLNILFSKNASWPPVSAFAYVSNPFPSQYLSCPGDFNERLAAAVRTYYYAGNANVVKGCVIHGLNHATYANYSLRYGLARKRILEWKWEGFFLLCSYHKLGELHVELLLLGHGDGGSHSLLDENMMLLTVSRHIKSKFFSLLGGMVGITQLLREKNSFLSFRVGSILAAKIQESIFSAIFRLKY